MRESESLQRLSMLSGMEILRWRLHHASSRRALVPARENVAARANLCVQALMACTHLYQVDFSMQRPIKTEFSHPAVPCGQEFITTFSLALRAYVAMLNPIREES